MKREIIAYKGYFKEFFENLDAGTQDKILYVLMLLQTQDRIPLKFMRLIEEGLYELRIEYQSNISSNPQLSSSASFLRLNVLSSLN